MEINKARRFQKQLYLKSKADPRSGTTFDPLTNKLCYYVSHKISSNIINLSDFSNELIEIINKRKDYGIHYAIKYNDEYIIKNNRYGIFLLEIIEID